MRSYLPPFLAALTLFFSASQGIALAAPQVSNPHSPNMYRVNGVVRNDDGWYAAFPEITPQDKMYLAPEKRVRLW